MLITPPSARPAGQLVLTGVPQRSVRFRCLRICAISVQGSRGTRERFRQDLARAQEVFGCALVVIQEGGFMQVNDPTLLNLNKWTTSTVPPDAMRLLAMGPVCGRPILSAATQPTVFAYYVGGLGGGYNGIGRPNFANGAPGLVVSDAGGDYTFAHEVGHVLGLNPTDHDPDPNNIMYFDSPNITSIPPVITRAQCDLAQASTIPTPCPGDIVIPPARAPQVVRRPPFETTPGLQGLLSDEPGVVERFAAMGQSILPQLLSRVGDPDLAIRVRVLAVLGAMARMGIMAALRPVEMALLTDPSPVARAAAAEALAESGSPMASTMLALALRDSDPGVRAAVLRSLALVRTPDSLMNVGLAAMRETDPMVRLLVARLAMVGA